MRELPTGLQGTHLQEAAEKDTALMELLGELRSIEDGKPLSKDQLAGLLQRISMGSFSISPHLLMKLIDTTFSVLHNAAKKEEDKKIEQEKKNMEPSISIYEPTRTALQPDMPQPASSLTPFFNAFGIESAADKEDASIAILTPEKIITDITDGIKAPKREVVQMAFLSNSYKTDYPDPVIRVEKITDHKTCGDALNIFTRTPPIDIQEQKAQAKFERQEIPLKTLQKLAGTSVDGVVSRESRNDAIIANAEKAFHAAQTKEQLTENIEKLKANIAEDKASTPEILKNKQENLVRMENLKTEAGHQAVTFKTAAHKVMVMQEITDHFKLKETTAPLLPPETTAHPVLDQLAQSEPKKAQEQATSQDIKRLQDRINIMTDKLCEKKGSMVDQEGSDDFKILAQLIAMGEMTSTSPSLLTTEKIEAIHGSLHDLTALNPELGIKTPTTASTTTEKTLDDVLSTLRSHTAATPAVPLVSDKNPNNTQMPEAGEKAAFTLPASRLTSTETSLLNIQTPSTSLPISTGR